ncbi:MAG TPA: ABC transporter permease, partial [Bryobacteraceae bacterium]|nr:ABC transporter permease [Bryobacteraceae bacterium]
AYLRDHVTTVEQLIAHYSTAPLYVSTNAQSGEVQGAVVSANYFPTLGVTPLTGRFFTPQEDSTPDRDAVAVIGAGLWHSWFGGDPGVLGKSIRINGRAFQVIGVAPESFQGIEVGASPNQIWIPTMMLRVGYRWCDAIYDDDCTVLGILGRLVPGKTAQQAGVELAALAGQFAASRPGKDVSQGVVAVAANGARLAEQRERLRVARLLAITAMALLAIGCINLAGLLIARSTARAKEIAMRLSLGAGRGRILQQLLTECVLLAAMGGTVGLMLSLWTNQMLIGFYTVDSEGYRRFFDMSLDSRTVLYALALSLATGVLFGMLPALQSARQDTAEVMKSSAGTGDRGRSRSILVTCQVALSLTLLVGAGLLARSVETLEAGQKFDPRHVALLRLRPRLVGYSPERSQVFQREVVRRLEAMPGVVSVSFTAGDGAVWTQGNTHVPITLPKDERVDRVHQRTAWRQQIAPKFFATLRVPMVQGREFDDRDQAGSPGVAIVSETLARQLWPGAAAMERTLLVDGQPRQVVGVVQDTQLRNALDGAVAMVYVPYWQNASLTDSRMCIRVADDPEASLARIKGAIASVDPDVPITETLPMIAQVRGAFTNVRLVRSVLLSAGGLALLLSAIGLYGVLAFVVGRRTREIGIRMAIGARPGQVLMVFLKQGLVLAGLGCAAGLVLALATTRLLGAFLYGVRARDPLAFVVGVVVLFGVAMAATYLPARRAARVDPMVALRYE